MMTDDAGTQLDRRADTPTTATGRQYHLHVAAGDLPPAVLLPGDPFRVPVLAGAWDAVEDVAHHREYRSMRGSVRGVPIAACSTGIGGPSTEIALNELAAVGCTTFLRLGTTGGLQEPIRCGDIIISTAAVRWDGASDAYAPPEFPASSSYELILALIVACERLGLTYHLGVSASTTSFFAGQSRPSFRGFPGVVPERVEGLMRMGVLNFEMEAATIFTLCSIFGLRGGAACVVVADRFRNEFKPEGADTVLATLGAEALVALSQMDARSAAAGKKWFVPSV
jgi:uridine phosphorylase